MVHHPHKKRAEVYAFFGLLSNVVIALVGELWLEVLLLCKIVRCKHRAGLAAEDPKPAQSLEGNGKQRSG